MTDIIGDQIFEFPMYRLVIHYLGVESIVDDTKVTVDKDGCMIRFTDLDCLCYNAQLHIGRLLIDEPEYLFKQQYELKVFDKKNNMLYHEEAALINGVYRIKVNYYKDDNLKILINRVLFKDANYKSIRGRIYDYAHTLTDP